MTLPLSAEAVGSLRCGKIIEEAIPLRLLSVPCHWRELEKKEFWQE
jgi:hypothetical protein